MTDRSFQPKNLEETQRLKQLLADLSDADFERQVGHGWTIKATLAHLAFWDIRALTLIEKFEKEGVGPSDNDVDVINEVVRYFGDALSGRAAFDLWVTNAEALDKRIANLPDTMIDAVRADGNPFNLPRHHHRSEHREEIEKLLRKLKDASGKLQSGNVAR